MVVALDFTPEMKVFCKLFDRYLSFCLLNPSNMLSTSISDVMQYKFHLVIMVPVTSALLVPEPDSVHELVDHDARVNAARSQGHLKKKIN